MLQSNRVEYTQISPRLQTILQQVVDDVVERLGCVGALAATLENDKGLYLRASSFNVPPTQVQQFWTRGGLSPTGAQAIVFLDNARHQKNLAVTAVNEVHIHARPYSITDALYDLFRPAGDEKIVEQIQADLNIQQVVAVPFIVQNEVVGTLVALTAVPFSTQEIDFLVAFGHQAAAALQSHYQLTAMEALERVIFKLQARMTDEVEVLQAVVDAVVQELGYQGAMVATLEEGNALPVRAYALEGSNALLTQWEKMAGTSLISMDAVVYLDDEKYKDNLSVRAVKGVNGRPQNYLTSNNLYDLLRPIAPKAVADLAQTALGIKQVIAVPFYLENEIVGNLFAASRRPRFSAWEISILTTFGQQAAAGIRNARLYREAEEQRRIAEQFGRMAFSATASVHTLGNHIGAVRTYLHLLSGLAGYSTSQQQEILNNNASMLDRLRRASDMLANLHEPWQEMSDEPVSVNDCLVSALNAVYPQLMESSHTDNLAEEMGAHIHILLSPNLPPVFTASEMLTEAFRVLLKNARDALREMGKIGDLWISSAMAEDGKSEAGAARIRITVRDSGPGIPKENLPHIFDMGWTTKEGQGMGFGLFWARDYVQGLGGQLEVESVWGEGATFQLTLPVVAKA